jgi:hypothetical protein
MPDATTLLELVKYADGPRKIAPGALLSFFALEEGVGTASMDGVVHSRFAVLVNRPAWYREIPASGWHPYAPRQPLFVEWALT